MSWYRTGTIAVTANSDVVTGSQTRWSGSVKAGDMLLIDGSPHEILSVDSNMQMTLAAKYRGETGSMKSYAVIPVSTEWSSAAALVGRVGEQVDAVNELLSGVSVTSEADALVKADSDGGLAGWTDSMRRATELEYGTVRMSDVVKPSQLSEYIRLEDGKIDASAVPDSVMTMNAAEVGEGTARETLDALERGTFIAPKASCGITGGESSSYCVVQVTGEAGRAELASGVDSHELWIRHRAGGSAAWSDWQMVSVGDSNDEAMSGTGQLNVSLTALSGKNDSEADGEYGISFGDSDAVNVNALYFGDVAERQSEGLNWYRDSGHWDSLRAYQGHLYFCPNRASGVHSGSEQQELLTTASSVTGTSRGVLSVDGSAHSLISQGIGTVAVVGEGGEGSDGLPVTGNGVSVLLGRANSAPEGPTEGFWLYAKYGSEPDAWLGTRPSASDSDITWRHVAFTDSDITGSAASAGTFTCSELAAGTDLNTVRDMGFYRCSLSGTAAGMSNAPVSEAFGLEVKPSGPEGAVVQTLTGYSTDEAGIHYRTYYSGVWSPWRGIPSTDGEWTGTLVSDAEYPLVKKAGHVNLSAPRSASARDCAVLVMRNDADTVNSSGGIMKLGALQPAESQDMFAGVMLDNPRGGNLPSDPLTASTGSCGAGVGVYYDYEANRGYAYAYSCALPSVSDSTSKLATTQWVQNRMKTAESRILALEKRLLDYETTIAALKSRLDALEAE